MYRLLLLILLLTSALPASAAPPQTLAVEALPPGTVRTDGNAPLYLLVRVEGSEVRGFEASDAEHANLVLTFDTREADNTMVTVENKGAVPLKLDLYLSDDDRTYTYTSSCPVGMTFETWPHSVPWLAVAGAHVAKADEISVCI
jgi:hypothetical protein